MRFYIMFGVTAILATIIYFYNPNSEYLGIYDEDVYIEYNYDKEGYFWIYDADDNITVKKENDSKWKITSKKDGTYNIVFYYLKDENNNDDYLYQINYTFKFDGKKTYWTYGEAFGLLEFPDPY